MTLERLQELAEEDAELVATLITIYAEQAPASLAEMHRLVAGQDGPALKIEAHTLKGVSLNLGLDEVAGTCKNLEEAGLTENFTEAAALLAQLEGKIEQALAETKVFITA